MEKKILGVIIGIIVGFALAFYFDMRRFEDEDLIRRAAGESRGERRR